MELLEYLESHDTIPDNDEGSVILEYIRDISSFLKEKYINFYHPLKQYMIYQNELSYEKIVEYVTTIINAASDIASFERSYINRGILKYLDTDIKEKEYHICFFEDMNDTKYIDLYEEASLYDILETNAYSENAKKYFNRKGEQ